MKTSDFFYELPQELIAQTPIQRRDASRLMTLDRTSGEVGHHHFYELPDFLRPGDCLILNDSRVLPARLLGQRLPGGGACEVLLLIDRGNQTWECLVRPGRKMKPGTRLHFPPWPHQTLPGLISTVDEQQHFTGTAARQPLSQQAGRQHSGVVQNQAVTRAQKIRQFVKMMMPHFTAGPIQGHETGGIPSLDGCLGNEFLGKFIKEITCFHAVAVLTRWLHR